MLSPFGKEVRKLRIDQSLLLRELAQALDVSVAWLSAVETGRKNVPENLVEKIIAYFELEDALADQLREVAALSRNEYKIRMGEDADEEKQKLAFSLARRFSDLTDAEIRDIQDILNRRRS